MIGPLYHLPYYNLSPQMSRSVDEVKSSELPSINSIMDQCESQADESMPAPKQYNHVGLLGILKLLAFILLKLLAVAWAFLICMQSEKKQNGSEKKLNEQTCKQTDSVFK